MVNNYIYYKFNNQIAMRKNNVQGLSDSGEGSIQKLSIVIVHDHGSTKNESLLGVQGQLYLSDIQ